MKAASTAQSARLKLRQHATTSGWALAVAGAPALILETASGSALTAPLPQRVLAVGSCLACLASALTLFSRPLLGRVLSSCAVLGALALGLPLLEASPGRALTSLIAATLALALLWQVGSPLLSLSSVRLRMLCEGQAQGAALGALSLWVPWVLTDPSHSPLDTWVLTWALGNSAWLSFEWLMRTRSERPRRALTVGVALGVSALAAALSAAQPGRSLAWLAVAATFAALSIGPPARPGREEVPWWDALASSPERVFVGTFAALCLVGGVVLAVPISSADGHPLPFITAVFTATSAVCVTGLSTIDISTELSVFGQVALLVMIQVGGLGIMTFSTAALWAFGRRLSLRHEGVVASLISTHDRSRLFATASQILYFTLGAEFVGGVVLTMAFVLSGDGFGMALWRGMFTAVSAFCNAGFALQGDSLVSYQDNAVVLHTVGLLIILGGLSPLTIAALPRLARRSALPVPAQVKLGLSAALLLLVLGFAMFLAVEWNGALASLSPIDRVHNAWFQSVTLRTAGFNSVDLTAVQPSSLSWMLLWMLIGGSPGGTAGGVKTTTVAVLLLAVLQAIRGREFVQAFGKRIPGRTLLKAVVVVVVAAASGLFALIAMQLTQAMSTQLALFEVVSALGTVGLTLGGTGMLDGIGKAIIIGCMFAGRVGGLTLLLFLASRKAEAVLDRPEEEIDVG